MTTPTTQAGRLMVKTILDIESGMGSGDPVAAILAIEAEARVPLEAKVATLVEAAVTAHRLHLQMGKFNQVKFSPIEQCPVQSCQRWSAILADLSAAAQAHDDAMRAEGVAAERERLRGGLTHLWEAGEEAKYLGPFCREHHAPVATCGCDESAEDFHYEPTPPDSSTWYVGHQWLLRDAVLALLDSSTPEGECSFCEYHPQGKHSPLLDSHPSKETK